MAVTAVMVVVAGDVVLGCDGSGSAGIWLFGSASSGSNSVVSGGWGYGSWS